MMSFVHVILDQFMKNCDIWKESSLLNIYQAQLRIQLTGYINVPKDFYWQSWLQNCTYVFCFSLGPPNRLGGELL